MLFWVLKLPPILAERYQTIREQEVSSKVYPRGALWFFSGSMCCVATGLGKAQVFELEADACDASGASDRGPPAAALITIAEDWML